jgi:dipeptidyl aminopeptidase/acylaminoacyl peptidase
VQASPVTYVNQTTAYPPFLIVHGSADQIVPETQSEELAAALKAAGGAVMLQVIPGASHDIEKGGNVELAKQFFKNTLKP